MPPKKAGKPSKAPAHPNTRSQAARAQTQSQQAPNPTQATPSAGNPPIPAYILEGRGAHWDRIYNNVETVVGNLEQDPFLNGLLARHVGDLRAMPGLEDQETFLYLVTRFIDRTNEFTTARQAIIYLARSDWDLEIALTNYEMAEEGMSLAEISGSDSSASESSGETSEPETVKINRHVDREPAVKGVKSTSKFVIVVNRTEGLGPKTFTFQKFNRGTDMDWDSSEQIRDLNRWRSQIIRRNISEARPRRIRYHPEELDWLTFYHEDHKTRHIEASPAVPVDWHTLDWNAITADFNRQFAGDVTRQDAAPRPRRSKLSLKTQSYRIPAVSVMTGRTLKVDKTVKSRKGGKDGKGDGDGDGGGGGGGKGSGGPAKKGPKKG